MSLHELSQHIAAQGRGGDTMLLHVSPAELAGLDALARQFHGRNLPINPKTGLKEADLLGAILPIAAFAAGTYFGGPGVGAAAAAAVSGGYAYATSGNLLQGLAVGAASYGLGSLAGGLAGAGATDAADQAAGQGASSASDVAAQEAGQGVTTAAVQDAGQPLAQQLAPQAMNQGLAQSVGQGTAQNADQQLLQAQLAGQPSSGGLSINNNFGNGFLTGSPADTGAAPGGIQGEPPPVQDQWPQSAVTNPSAPSGPPEPSGLQSALNWMEQHKNMTTLGAMGLAGLIGQMQQNKYRPPGPLPTPAYRNYRYQQTPTGGYNPGAPGQPIPSYFNQSYTPLSTGSYAPYGYAGGGLLNGPGDGQSDNIPATIEGQQPARLAEGEFVVPADVVGHIGNGSTKAGAQRLYDMMARVRQARTGNSRFPTEINSKKYLPA